jgi:hypothetical protein
MAMQCKEVEVVLEQEGWTPLPEGARAHVAACNSCQSLVSDLSTIVASAHLLPAEVEPPARVWVSLRAQLQAEGIIKTHTAAEQSSWWHGFSDVFRARVMATAAVGLLIIGAVVLQVQGPATHPTEARNVYDDTATALDQDEAHLPPAQLANRSMVEVSLRQNLGIVDNFIADCERRVKEQPQDDLAREYLSGAYQQKAELLSALMEPGGSGN